MGALADYTPIDNTKLAMGMYSNQRACKVGDLLTISISEASSSKKSEDLKTDKTAYANAKAPFFGSQIPDAGNMFTKLHNSFVRANEYDLPFNQYEIQASSKFTGSGQANSSDALNMNFTVRVVDVLQNGILVVRGDRRILIRNETMSMVITGLVRVRDISDQNIIDSNRVADAHIYYETDGEVSRGSRPGYMWRVFQFLNPF